jgi:urease accessory protein
VTHLVASAVVRARAADATTSDVHRARGAGPLRLLTPRAAGKAAWIVTSSLGGGLVHGDEVVLEVEIDRGATCVLTTQASTKAYRGQTHQETRARVADGAAAIVIPDPLVPFRDARVRQVTRIELAAEASLVLVDTLTAGRLAHGERWSCARADTSLTVVRAGTTLLHDRVVLDRAHGELAARMQRFVALATVIVIGPRVAMHARALLAEIAALPLAHADLVIAASPLGDDGVVLRIASTEIERLIATTRVHLQPACTTLGEDPWARKW